MIALFFLGGDLLSPYSWPAVFLQQLLMVNLVLGLFNLIPAFPMDGGRVLRALLSGWLGRVRATMAAARVGRALAVLFGILSLANNPIQVALVHVALASFIYLAAKGEEAQVVPRRDADRDLAPTTRASGLPRPVITGSAAETASGNWLRSAVGFGEPSSAGLTMAADANRRYWAYAVSAAPE